MSSKKIEISVGGMQCEHCAMHVKDALEKIEGVTSVEVDLGKKQALLAISEEIDLEEVKKVLAAEDYEYLGVVKG